VREISAKYQNRTPPLVRSPRRSTSRQSVSVSATTVVDWSDGCFHAYRREPCWSNTYFSVYKSGGSPFRSFDCSIDRPPHARSRPRPPIRLESEQPLPTVLPSGGVLAAAGHYLVRGGSPSGGVGHGGSPGMGHGRGAGGPGYPCSRSASSAVREGDWGRAGRGERMGVDRSPGGLFEGGPVRQNARVRQGCFLSVDHGE
jgi:hypothetical protein